MGLDLAAIVVAEHRRQCWQPQSQRRRGFQYGRENRPSAVGMYGEAVAETEPVVRLRGQPTATIQSNLMGHGGRWTVGPFRLCSLRFTAAISLMAAF